MKNMKIVVIDTETTHVIPGEAQVLELGIVLYDPLAHNNVESITKNAPKLTMLIYRENIKGSFATIDFNLNLIKTISDEIKSVTNKDDLSFYKLNQPIMVNNKYGDNHHLIICTPEQVVTEFFKFVDGYGFVERTARYINGNVDFNVDPNNFKYIFKAMYMAGKNISTFDIPVLKADIPFWEDNVKMKHRQIDPSITFTTARDQNVPDLKTCFQRLGAFEHVVAHRAVDDCIDVALLLHFHFKTSKFKRFGVYKDSQYIESVIENSPEYDKYSKDKDYILISENELVKGAIMTRIDSFKDDCMNSNSLYAGIFNSEYDHKLNKIEQKEYNTNITKDEISNNVADILKTVELPEDSIDISDDVEETKIEADCLFSKPKEDESEIKLI